MQAGAGLMVAALARLEEGKLDLEMLYKAIVTNGDKIRTIFQ